MHMPTNLPTFFILKESKNLPNFSFKEPTDLNLPVFPGVSKTFPASGVPDNGC